MFVERNSTNITKFMIMYVKSLLFLLRQMSAKDVLTFHLSHPNLLTAEILSYLIPVWKTYSHIRETDVRLYEINNRYGLDACLYPPHWRLLLVMYKRTSVFLQFASEADRETLKKLRMVRGLDFYYASHNLELLKFLGQEPKLVDICLASFEDGNYSLSLYPGKIPFYTCLRLVAKLFNIDTRESINKILFLLGKRESEEPKLEILKLVEKSSYVSFLYTCLYSPDKNFVASVVSIIKKNMPVKYLKRFAMTLCANGHDDLLDDLCQLSKEEKVEGLLSNYYRHGDEVELYHKLKHLSPLPEKSELWELPFAEIKKLLV